MDDLPTAQTHGPSEPVYSLTYAQSFETALAASRFFQARQIVWYYVAFTAGLPIGAAVSVLDLTLA